MEIAIIVCASIEDRDAILDLLFPDRCMTEVPGAYTLTKRRGCSILVHLTTITVYWENNA